MSVWFLSGALPALAAAAGGGAPGFPMTLRDALGRTVTVPEPPARIVSLTPSVTEILYALGLGDRVIGVSKWSDYPAEAQAKPAVGDALALNYEKLIALEPDLVVGDANLVKNFLQKLSELKLRVFAIAPTSLDEVMEAVLQVGAVTGRKTQADKVVQEMKKRRDAVVAALKGLPESRKPRVFVEIWNEPLMTAGPGSFIDELVKLAGGRNIAFDAGSAWPQFSPELVVARNPEVIVLTQFNKKEVEKRAAWGDLAALKRGRVHEIDSSPLVRTSPRLVEGLELLARLFHPEIFPVSEVRDNTATGRDGGR